MRNQELAFEIAAEVLRRYFLGLDGATKPWLFPALLDVTKRWLDEKVTFAADTPPGVLLFAEHKAKASAKADAKPAAKPAVKLAASNE